MKPGHTYILKCPGCDHLVWRDTLESATGLGGRLFSDSRYEVSYFPQHGHLVECDSCSTLYWLEKAECVDRFMRYEPKAEEYRHIPKPQAISIPAMIRALKEGLAQNHSDEFYVRQSLWHAYNKRIPEGLPLYIDDHDETTYKENCLRLLEMMDPDVDYLRPRVAELKRNLGDFEGCLAILLGYRADYDNMNEDFCIGIERCIRACEEGLTETIELTIKD